MKNWMIITLCICLSMSSTACSQRGDAKEPVLSQSQSINENSSTSSDQIVSEPPVSSDDNNNLSDELDEYGLPVMSEENQQIYDKYFMPLDFANYIFISSFSENNFEHFAPVAVYSCLARPKEENSDVPKDEVESLIMQYFPISVEEIHKNNGRWDYDEEKQTYSIFTIDREYAQNYRGAVVSSEIDGDKLIVKCVWNDTVYPENPNSFKYRATSVTTIIIKSDTEWFYESNQAIESGNSASESAVAVSMININKSIDAFEMKENDTEYGWTLTEIEPYDTPPEAAFYGFLTFTGEVALTGTITHVNAIYDGFEFVPNEESKGKMLIPDGNPEKDFFVSIINADEPSIAESISELAVNESGEYTIVLTQYSLAYVPMMATNNAIVSTVKKK